MSLVILNIDLQPIKTSSLFMKNTLDFIHLTTLRVNLSCDWLRISATFRKFKILETKNVLILKNLLSTHLESPKNIFNSFVFKANLNLLFNKNVTKYFY